MTQIPGKCYSLCNHLNEQWCGLNLKIYCVTCPDTIRTQNGVHIPILYRILRFLQDIPPILQLENILIQLIQFIIYKWALINIKYLFQLRNEYHPLRLHPTSVLFLTCERNGQDQPWRNVVKSQWDSVLEMQGQYQPLGAQYMSKMNITDLIITHG